MEGLDNPFDIMPHTPNSIEFFLIRKNIIGITASAAPIVEVIIAKNDEIVNIYFGLSSGVLR